MQQISPPHSQIGWIGTVVMGAAMCEHLLNAGYDATLHTRTRAKAQPLLDRGTTWADRLRAVASVSDVVVTTVGFPTDVRKVYSGATGLVAGAQALSKSHRIGTRPKRNPRTDVGA